MIPKNKIPPVTTDKDHIPKSVADPGFPVGGGGVHPLGRAWTSDAGTFQ